MVYCRRKRDSAMFVLRQLKSWPNTNLPASEVASKNKLMAQWGPKRAADPRGLFCQELWLDDPQIIEECWWILPTAILIRHLCRRKGLLDTYTCRTFAYFTWYVEWVGSQIWWLCGSAMLTSFLYCRNNRGHYFPLPLYQPELWWIVYMIYINIHNHNHIYIYIII